MPYYLIPHTEERIWRRASRRLEPEATVPPYKLIDEAEPAPVEPETDPEDEPEGWS